ncbi:MAG: ribosome small subunit-dependent GTPase A [Spirochaetaceae bacterium]
MSNREGRILFGINNIYAVLILRGSVDQPEVLRCRIKGKILQGVEGEYNPLAPGDIVEVEESGSEGMIVARRPRRNSLSRWNRKRHRLQVLGTNLDCVVVISCTGTPPFRPRFVDRALALCEHEAIDATIVVNKVDLGLDPGAEDRIADYRSLGYQVVLTSAKEGSGFEALFEMAHRETLLFLGHSGVGKSSLLNRLLPDANQRVGDVSVKYRRGRHTTNYAILHPVAEGGIVDTPGIRELDLYPLSILEISHGYREIRRFAGECGYPNCTHLHEPDCAVLQAVKEGAINLDRYQSYRFAVEDREATASREEP